jgi:hypothetical protein
VVASHKGIPGHDGKLITLVRTICADKLAHSPLRLRKLLPIM